MGSPPPSAHVRELIRQGAQRALQVPEEWFVTVDDATLSTPATVDIAADPALSQAMRAANRDAVRTWASANVRAPGDPVPANTSPVQLALARDLVRRGLDEAALDGYRTGQGAAWQFWMRICFALDCEPGELEQLLTLTAASIEAFVSGTIAAVAQCMKGERAALTRGSEAERRELVTLILQGAPVTRTRAESQLRYRLDGDHVAAVIWSTQPEVDLAGLERVAEAMMVTSGARTRLTVIAAASTLWVWLPIVSVPEHGPLHAALQRIPQVRMAIGTTARGTEGFRRSHQNAVETQRFMSRTHRSPNLASFTQIELAALATQDHTRAEQFIQHVLGEFVSAPTELRDTVSAYLMEMGNASATATRLSAHRNTILRRLAQADQLLPRALHEDPLQIGVALEILRWRAEPHRPVQD